MVRSAAKPCVSNHEAGELLRVWPHPSRRLLCRLLRMRSMHNVFLHPKAIIRSQPTFAPLEALQVLEALALVARAAEIEFLDVFIITKFIGAAVEHHLALFHDIAVAGD